MDTFASTEDLDEMLHNVAFHQGLHCLLRQINFKRKKFNIFQKLLPLTTQYIQWTILTLLFKFM